MMLLFNDVAKINLYTLLLIPGLFIIYFNIITYGLVLSMIGARYRDIPQIIKSLIGVIFFITPIMWKPDIFSEDKRILFSLNPFYSFAELIRAPLIGYMPTPLNLITVSVFTFIGILLSLYIFPARRARIIYWI